jgi:hypothetical protein
MKATGPGTAGRTGVAAGPGRRVLPNPLSRCGADGMAAPLYLRSHMSSSHHIDLIAASADNSPAPRFAGRYTSL